MNIYHSTATKRTPAEKRARLVAKLAKLDRHQLTDVDRRLAQVRRDDVEAVEHRLREVMADSVREKMREIESHAIAERLQQLKCDAKLYRAAGLKKLVEGDTGILRLYGSIGGDYEDGISAEAFALAVDDLGPIRRLELRVNSPGGSAFDGIAIYNLLRRHPAKVSVCVDGVAASAASIVAMAADPGQLSMGESSLLMVHRAWSMSIGNAADHSKSADMLDNLDRTIAGCYAGRTGRSVDFWLATMSEESWFTADEAIAARLADSKF